MNARVLATAEATAWEAVLAQFPDADVYHRAVYHGLHEDPDQGRAHGFVAEQGGNCFFHPLLTRPVRQIGQAAAPEGWCDAETVYGYSGPLATTTDAAFLAAAWATFHEWCIAERVLCELVRFNPLSGNWRYADAALPPVVNRQTVVLTLPATTAALWTGYPSVQRNMVRKAQAAGLTVAEVPLPRGLPGFRDLYRETMRRLGASSCYYFSDRYFAALAAWGAPGVRLFGVHTPAGECAAAALFLVHGERLHYHLAAADSQCRHLAPANLLLHGAACWGLEHNLRYLHLGGGRTAMADDALLRFKASLSRERCPFMVGTRVHHAEMYDEFCSRWRQQARRPAPTGYLQFYRLE